MKITKMLGLVLSIYFILDIPTLVTKPPDEKSPKLSTFIVYYVVTLVFYISSWANVFIYAVNNKDFRSAFKKMVGMKDGTDSGNTIT